MTIAFALVIALSALILWDIFVAPGPGRMTKATYTAVTMMMLAYVATPDAWYALQVAILASALTLFARGTDWSSFRRLVPAGLAARLSRTA